MSQGNNNDPNSFTNLLGGWGNPYGGSSSNPNPNPNWDNPNVLGATSQEVFQQHEAWRYWEESRQNTLQTDFQNLQFTQPSQQSHTETNEVPETPTSPPKKTKPRVKRKSKKAKDPVEVDDDDDEAPNPTRWDPNEEKLLATCWVAASEDPTVGRSQAKDTFWQRVQNEFNKHSHHKRGKDMIQSKWRTLNRDCTKFNGIFSRADRDQRSGESPMDVLARAKEMYRNENKNAPFHNEEAWGVLRAHKKWDTPDTVDLTGDVPSQANEALFGQDAQPRPMGKKRATKKQKSETTTSTGGASTGGSASSVQFGEALREEYRAKREEAALAYKATDENQYAAIRVRDFEFLLLDTTGKDPYYVNLVNKEKDRIIAKYNLPPRDPPTE